jgi:hypothetical protein
MFLLITAGIILYIIAGILSIHIILDPRIAHNFAEGSAIILGIIMLGFFLAWPVLVLGLLIGKLTLYIYHFREEE